MSEHTDLVKKEKTAMEQRREIPAVAPLVDIFENDEEILLQVDMPGVDKDEISINIDNGRLTLDGVRKMQPTGVMQWKELVEVEFQRTFSVPQTIDVAGVHAEFKDGVLGLHLPKSEKAKPRQIEIKAA